MTQIADSTILVTGAGRGLGRRLALEMARLGGNLVLWDLDEAAMGWVQEEIAAAGGPAARRYVCDVADREAVYAAAAEVREEVGPVHVLVNNAGVVSGRPFLELDDEQIRQTVAVNTMS